MKQKKTKSNKKLWLIVVLSILLIIPVIGVIIIRFEKSMPVMDIALPERPIGDAFDISGSISDRGSGLRNFWVGILQNGSEKVILDVKYPSGLIHKGGETQYETIKKTVDLQKLSLEDGKATIRMVVSDFSWRDKGRGNRTYIEKEILIDTAPPEIDILSTTHNVSQGGTCLVIYNVSEEDIESGVFVGSNFFPGYSGYYENKAVYISYFSVGSKQDGNTRIYVSASDKAGNKSQAGFSYYIRKRNFKKDRINISDNFLNRKMPEFDTREFGISEVTGLEKFLAVNSKLRIKNGEKITSPAGNTDKTKYWEGAFGRLPKSANKANFADHRSYFYKGKLIDNQFHMGIDLASVKRSKVPASNKGKIVLTENIGIYGKTVVIDHGFGLFSLYSHLSQIDVTKGSIVSKGEIIGRTGTTGLAGGDHLHFGMFVHTTFVNPVEWWDAMWIQNNILSKLEDVESTIQ